MAVTVETVERMFHHGQEILPDPDPNMTPEQVLSFYSARYPELAIGHIDKMEVNKQGQMVYIVKTVIGSKG
jgi:PRTRC genetic system protein C